MADVTRERGAENLEDLSPTRGSAAASSQILLDGDGGDEVIARLAGQASFYMRKERREDLREGELVKLREMGFFIEIERDQILKDAKVFFPRWVGTAEKSRLVVADVRSGGPASNLTGVSEESHGAVSYGSLEVVEEHVRPKVGGL